MKFIDITNQSFGKLFIVRYYGKDKGGRSQWLCKCKCGKEVIVEGYNLRSGHSKSCGCSKSESTIKAKTTHGASKTATYRTWRSIINRCENPNTQSFHLYGGRGIKICARWRSFSNFLLDMGEKPIGMSIDRIDNDGDYEPSNCKWSTNKEQSSNTRRNHRITYMGETKILTQWIEDCNLSKSSFYYHLKKSNDSLQALLSTKKYSKKRV